MSQLNRRDQSTALPLTTWWNQYHRELSDAETHRVTAFVRSFAPAPGQHDTRAAVLGGLQSAVESGPLDSHGLTVLGEQICRCQNCQNSPEATRLLDTAEALAGWENNGLRATGFDERTVQSTITGEEYRVIVPPELSIGIYADDSLVGVFPSASDSELFRPLDYVDTLLENPADRPGSTVQEIS